MANRNNPMDIWDPENQYLLDWVILSYAQFKNTTQIVDAMLEHQTKEFPESTHKTRSELREMIRTINPQNAKFNQEKWGDLLETYRQEFVAELRTQMCDNVGNIIKVINTALANATIQIRTPKDVVDCLKIMKLVQEISQDGKKDSSHLDLSVLGSIATPPLEPATTETVESPQTEALAPAESGKNGQPKQV